MNMEAADSGVLVAVATKHGRQVDLHFGHADEFHLYRIDGQGVHLVEVRKVEHYCQEGEGDDDRREQILRALAGCAALFVARVGDGPRARLEEAGIEPVAQYAHEEIEPSLITWYQSRAAS